MIRRNFIKSAVKGLFSAFIYGNIPGAAGIRNTDASMRTYINDKNQKLIKSKWRNGRIFRLAGTGMPGYSGDDGPAVTASLNGPAGLAVDQFDNIYIAEILSSVIRKVDSKTGIITTVAGCGRLGYSGDGGPAIHAELNRPEGVCVDYSGNIYIADSGNQRIRRVDAQTNIITTIAGIGETGIEISDCPALNARLNHPSGIAVDIYANIYFNDYGNDLIKKIDRHGVLSTIAGTGKPGYSGDGGPGQKACINDVYGIGIDKKGNLFFVDSLNFAVRKIDNHSGKVYTVVGKGKPGEIEEFVSKDKAYLCGVPHRKGTIGSKVAHGVEPDSHGNIFIAETGINRIRMLHSETGMYFTIAGNGNSGLPEEGSPALASGIEVHGVRADSKGNLYYVDFIHHVVNRISFSNS